MFIRNSRNHTIGGGGCIVDSFCAGFIKIFCEKTPILLEAFLVYIHFELFLWALHTYKSAFNPLPTHITAV